MTTRGMMAENMFSGKAAILGWLNSVLGLKLEKIEDVRCTSRIWSLRFEGLAYQTHYLFLILQTCTGAVACQLMDCLHPGSVNMKKVCLFVDCGRNAEKGPPLFGT